jgi:hypothetical protein
LEEVNPTVKDDCMFKMLKYRNEMRTWQKKFDASAPRVGDIAPDFILSDTTGGNFIRLSDFKDKKPVGLIFGSFT